MARDKETFKRAFAAASVHDMFNLLAVVIMLPLELTTHVLERLSGFFAGQLAGTDGGVFAAVFGGLGNVVTSTTKPLSELIQASVSGLTPVWGGLVLIMVGVVLILASINYIGVLLKVLMVGKAKEVMCNSVGRSPASGMVAGLLLTVLVQSSSTTTSLIVPLAGAGTFNLKQVYPFTLGANVGTTVTALIAAFAFSGPTAALALQAALVHCLYNVIALIIIYGLPFLRPLPIKGAELLAHFGSKSKFYVAAWVLGVFLVLPGSLIALTVLL